MPLRLPKKIKTKLRIWAILSAISISRKITILKNVLKSQNTSDGLSNLYVKDWKEKRRIRIGTLYLISYDLQEADRGPVSLK